MSVSKNMSLDLSDLYRRDEARIAAIGSILDGIKPLECQMLGKKTVRQIAAGKSFATVDSGHQMTFVELISVLSGFASIAPLAFMVVGAIRARASDEETTAVSDETKNDESVKAEAKQLIESEVKNRPELHELSEIIEQDDAAFTRILTEVMTRLK